MENVRRQHDLRYAADFQSFDHPPSGRELHGPFLMQPVLILGAGINGAALARELAWQGVPVVVVDAGDLASGATAYSSRLIHGGLRYLEYAEFGLVAESLAERARLVNLARIMSNRCDCGSPSLDDPADSSQVR